MELFLRWPMEWEKPGWIWRVCGHTSYKHVFLQTKISHKSDNEMKFHEIPIWDLEDIFLSICGNPSVVSWEGRKIPLNMVVRAASLGQIHAQIQSMISHKSWRQMRFREIPIWYMEEIFPSICINPIVVSWSGIKVPLNMVVHVASLGQLHLEIQSMVSLKPGSQMIFREIPIWDL